MILDNAGFELYTDFCLSIWLLKNNYCTNILWHIKKIPWFVSDTTIGDIDYLC